MRDNFFPIWFLSIFAFRDAIGGVVNRCPLRSKILFRTNEQGAQKIKEKYCHRYYLFFSARIYGGIKMVELKGFGFLTFPMIVANIIWGWLLHADFSWILTEDIS